jgi:flagellar basal body rod protein FlgG
MDSLMVSAASGMKSRMESLEMLANNVANSGTTAFKADREFYGVYVSEAASLDNQSGEFKSPVIDKHWTDFSQGTLVNTTNPLDLGVSGAGFFTIDSPSGPLYTRNGNFRLGTDGQIETQDGNKLRVKTQDGRPLKLDPQLPIEIGKDGTVRQSGQELGKIQMADFDNNSALVKRGSTYFQWLEQGSPKAASPELHQGTIESSNVPVAEAAVRLVSVMRQFEMLQRAMTLGSEMNRRAIDEVAKVS